MRLFALVSLTALAALTQGPRHRPALPYTASSGALSPTTFDYAVPVLMYHRVADLTPAEARSPLMRDLTVSPANFEEQVRTLKESGFTFLLASQVEQAVREHLPLPEKAVAVTLDDGYEDNFSVALPILRKYGVPATVFVVTASVDKPQRLSWGQILLMKAKGIGFGSHTVHHYDLTTLPESVLDEELQSSKRLLEFRLQQPVQNLAYPSGRYDERVKGRARAAGYLAAWKKGGGPVRPGDDLLMLPRVRVHGRTTLADFERKLKSGLEQLAMERSGESRPKNRSMS